MRLNLEALSVPAVDNNPIRGGDDDFKRELNGRVKNAVTYADRQTYIHNEQKNEKPSGKIIPNLAEIMFCIRNML